MDWYQTINEHIDLRSFSNLWFWIVLGVVWSTASYYVLGVPYDMVQRARRFGGDAAVDLEDMVRINVNRLIYIAQVSGLWVLGFTCFAFTSLGLLAIAYNVEFAQALMLLAFPLSLVGLLSLRTARVIQTEEASGERLHKRLMRHRLYTQIIGMISIFVTAMWGMYQNLTLGSLGG
ncbi:component of SufBCD complex [Sulfitobacter aestuariivivens]|uniref:Component of SufBCD complex n=1 Tax=Sulfitobacter aestuariivivens TaxID=2766981 RepID=A0A927HD18_9RHOB|nr:component of SufBCD complex [Sulfitobacter aestuariivivens]MBD3663187.1 component of SufBCD complex [Sulfitobacter aestuariivivens]